LTQPASADAAAVVSGVLTVTSTTSARAAAVLSVEARKEARHSLRLR
jgi:hypothetical protein